MEIIQNIINDPELSGKLAIAIKSSIFIVLFAAGFFYFYRRYFWKDLEARRLFWVFLAIFVPLAVIKFVIGVFFKGYIPELLFFYAIPSPKALGLVWWVLAIGTPALFLRFRMKIESLSTAKFLAIIISVFFVFSVSVAGLREGLASVADPFTRTYWEYTGFLPQIQDFKSFLGDYVDIVADPNLAVARHANTHPPGYTAVLYFLHRLFGAGNLGLALLVVVLGGLTSAPILFFWRQFLSEIQARRAVEIFVFAPGLVMTAATSMESFLLLATWLAITLCFRGWKKNIFLSALGGLAAAFALFSNFLVLLLAPLFVFLVWLLLKNQASRFEEWKIVVRMLVSLAAFILFFAVLQQWSSYSIIDNFFLAQLNAYEAVGGNYAYRSTFWIFLFVNIIDFLIYAGLPLVIIFFRGLPGTFKESNAIFKFSIALAAFFLLLNIFQGNIGRLWLFILPLFMSFSNKLFREEDQPLFSSFLWLTVFQIFIMQTMFYTFF